MSTSPSLALSPAPTEALPLDDVVAHLAALGAPALVEISAVVWSCAASVDRELSRDAAALLPELGRALRYPAWRIAL